MSRRPPKARTAPARSLTAVVEPAVEPESIPPAVVEAALLIASGTSESKAAKATGVSRSTLGRWLRRPGFDSAISVLSKAREAEGRRASADALMEVVLSGGSVGSAAEKVGIARSTAYAYLREFYGVTGVGEARILVDEVVAAQRASLASLAAESLWDMVPKLTALVANVAEPAQIRAAALSTLRDLAAAGAKATVGGSVQVTAKAAAGSGPGGAGASVEVNVGMITPPPMGTGELSLDQVERLADILLGA